MRGSGIWLAEKVWERLSHCEDWRFLYTKGQKRFDGEKIDWKACIVCRFEGFAEPYIWMPYAHTGLKIAL